MFIRYPVNSRTSDYESPPLTTSPAQGKEAMNSERDGQNYLCN